jgi:hypothetical protein
MRLWRADEEPGSSDQQNPAVFWLAIRPTKQKPRKLIDVKPSCSFLAMRLTSMSLAVHLPWPD